MTRPLMREAIEGAAGTDWWHGKVSIAAVLESVGLDVIRSLDRRREANRDLNTLCAAGRVPNAELRLGHGWYVPIGSEVVRVWVAERFETHGAAKVPGRSLVGSVYAIQCATTGLTKIGFAVDVGRRLRELQVGCPTDLRVLYTAPGTISDEHAWQDTFRSVHHRGEWFRLTEEHFATMLAHGWSAYDG